MNDDTSIDVICMTGELDISRKVEIRNALRVNRKARAVLLDLSDVTYADSTALTEFLRFSKSAKDEGIEIALLIGNRQFSRLIQYAGLTETFAVFENRADALAHLAESVTR